MDASSCQVAMIAAPASRQGKTLVTCGLARRLVEQGKRVKIFKSGPDYLDPGLLEAASGNVVHNLDLWMVGEAQCRALIDRAVDEFDVVLVESAMGLFDGDPSPAQLAVTLDLPVVLVLNAAKYAQTAKAIVEGLRKYDPDVSHVGVIGNFVGSDNHHRLLCETLGNEYLGSVRRSADSIFPERHLGVISPADLPDFERRLALSAEMVGNIDLATLGSKRNGCSKIHKAAALPELLAGKTIAVARDRAFSFIYPENLAVLAQLGAQLFFFSPLANEPVPECDGIWLPGGYPELHGTVIENAAATRESLGRCHEIGVPLLAECGGMMACCREVIDAEGQSFRGFGLLDGRCHMHKKFQGIGLQSVNYGSGEIRGHGFHHSSIETPVAPLVRTTRLDGREGEAVFASGNSLLTYFHHYFASNPEAVAALFLKGVDGSSGESAVT